MLFIERNGSIKFVKCYGSIILEAKRKAAEEPIKQDETKQDETEQIAAGTKILTPKQMLQRLPIALVQVKAGNNSGNLLNEIRKIVYSLYQSKKITKKVYNNIIKSIQI